MRRRCERRPLSHSAKARDSLGSGSTCHSATLSLALSLSRALPACLPSSTASWLRYASTVMELRRAHCDRSSLGPLEPREALAGHLIRRCTSLAARGTHGSRGCCCERRARIDCDLGCSTEPLARRAEAADAHTPELIGAEKSARIVAFNNSTPLYKTCCVPPDLASRPCRAASDLTTAASLPTSQLALSTGARCDLCGHCCCCRRCCIHCCSPAQTHLNEASNSEGRFVHAKEVFYSL